jgi:predicted acetyltransferase
MIYLKETNVEDAKEEFKMIAQMPEDENGFTNPDAGINFEEYVNNVIPRHIKNSKGEDLPEGFVPQTDYFLWDDDKVVGLFRLRHYLNEHLRTNAGHIGYGIHRDYRGKGYASKGLELLLQVGKDIIEEDEFYLSVHKDNPASLQVQIKNGARIVREDDKNYFTRIPK